MLWLCTDELLTAVDSFTTRRLLGVRSFCGDLPAHRQTHATASGAPCLECMCACSPAVMVADGHNTSAARVVL